MQHIWESVSKNILKDTWKNIFKKSSAFLHFHDSYYSKKVDFNLKHALGIIAIIYINLSFYKLE